MSTIKVTVEVESEAEAETIRAAAGSFRGKPWQIKGSKEGVWIDYGRTALLTPSYRLTPAVEPDPNADIKAAHKAGKLVQFNYGRRRLWFNLDPTADIDEEIRKAGHECAWRVKPEPRIVPWTRETLPRIADLELVLTRDGTLYTVAGADNECMHLNRFGPVAYAQLLTLFMQRDGSPCGTKEEA